MREANAPPREWPEQSTVHPSLIQSGGREGGREGGTSAGQEDQVSAAKKVHKGCKCPPKNDGRAGGRAGMDLPPPFPTARSRQWYAASTTERKAVIKPVCTRRLSPSPSEGGGKGKGRQGGKRRELVMACDSR